MKASKNLFYLLICLAVIYILLYLWRRFRGGIAPATEGFTQSVAYSLKRDDEVYDDFYTDIYDDVYSTPQRINFEVQSVVEATQPSKNYSVILDVGCGTGTIVSEFIKRGYKAYGIDKSPAMYSRSCKACGGGRGGKEVIKHGDVMNPMTYEHNTFSHITCFYMTIYHLRDKNTFFRNCHGWLTNNGYLIIHFVDFKKFRGVDLDDSSEDYLTPPKFPLPPAVADAIQTTDLEHRRAAAQNANSIPAAEFKGVRYKNNLFTDGVNPDSWGEFLWKETFQDIQTGHVRQNEITLYTDEHVGYPRFYNGWKLEEHKFTPIVDMVLQCGFILQGVVDMDYLGKMYSHNYLYVFEKLA